MYNRRVVVQQFLPCSRPFCFFFSFLLFLLVLVLASQSSSPPRARRSTPRLAALVHGCVLLPSFLEPSPGRRCRGRRPLGGSGRGGGRRRRRGRGRHLCGASCHGCLCQRRVGLAVARRRRGRADRRAWRRGGWRRRRRRRGPRRRGHRAATRANPPPALRGRNKLLVPRLHLRRQFALALKEDSPQRLHLVVPIPTASS